MSEKERKQTAGPLYNKHSAAVQSFVQALIYFVFGCVWIVVSDNLMKLITVDESHLVLVSTIKGIVYVLITALIFYLLMYKAIKKIIKSNIEITQLAYYDELTGLLNRKYIEKNLPEIDSEIHLPISVIVGDFNGLKLVNDAYGHTFGDSLLELSAEALSKTCRPGDILSRWGNGEFLIVLPNTDPRETESLVEKLREECARSRLDSVSVDMTFGWGTKTQPCENIMEVINKAENLMYNHKIMDIKSMQSKTIKVIMSTLHEKNPREAAHSNRVGQICRLISEALGFSSMDSGMLTTIGFLHDIGKIAIGEHILNKSEKLTDAEFSLIRQHPEIGYRILTSSYGQSEMTEAVLSHHERWDGTGYPLGLKGEEIPRTSRIIAIADSYDAMTSERPYKTKMTAEEAREEIRRNAGTQFDPFIAGIFIDNVLPQLART